VGSQAFRLDEYLVLILVGKAMDLVFDRRAVTRANAFDDPGVHRRAIQVLADDVVGALVGMGNPAVDLLRMHCCIAHERHDRNRRITWLWRHLAEIDTATVDARRGAGFQPIHPQRQFTQALRECDGGRIARATAGVVVQTDVNQATEEGAGGQHHVVSQKTQTHLGNHATNLLVFDNQVIAGLLEDP